jgi:thiosulfate/3-mercaptopyruvate sulfurtransferase
MGLLVTPKAAEAWLEVKQAQVLDTRFRLGADGETQAKALFKAGHWPNAKHFNLSAFSDETSPYPNTVLAAEVFRKRWLDAGFSEHKPVLLIGDKEMPSAFRVWWLLQQAGFPMPIAILDGGHEACLNAGITLETGLSEQPPLLQENRSSQAWGKEPDVGLTHLAEVKQLVNSSNKTTQLIDARSEGRFYGESPEPRAGCKAGHIPSSLNLPYTRLFDPITGGLLAPLQLEALFSEAGFHWRQPAVSTCGSGVTACVLAFALRYMGYPLALSVYDGSWSEWGSQPDTLIAVK